MSAAIRLGTQGWNYDAWVGPLYPSGTRAPDFLGVYARAFDTVEVDSTFYAIPAARTVRSWADRVGDDFTFALKLPRAVTHEHRLRDADDLTQLFFERARELGPKLGPVLVQLGPDFGPDELPALAAFLPTLPRDLAVAVEFRHRGWLREAVLTLLAEHNVALALSDGRWVPRKAMLTLAARPTASFAYIRWMGPNRDLTDYSRVQIDRSAELELWSHAIFGLSRRVPTIYGYINNHFAGHSPATVRALQQLLGLPSVEPDTLGEQMTLF
jgi:uncharacterized protein YecE (DUF72 family)